MTGLEVAEVLAAVEELVGSGRHFGVIAPQNTESPA
jgi:hypothetical protein